MEASEKVTTSEGKVYLIYPHIKTFILEGIAENYNREILALRAGVPNSVVQALEKDCH